MRHETTLHYTETDIRSAAIGYWRRTLGAHFFIGIAALALGLIWLINLGVKNWFAGAMAAVLVLSISTAIALYMVHFLRGMQKFKAMGNAQATFHAGDSSFTFTSSIGSTTLQWKAVEELWQFQTVWLLLYSKAQFNTLPTRDLSPEMQAFIVDRLQQAGTKIVK